MRMIGHLETESGARTFSDYLYAEGIGNQIEAERNGTWALWIQDEDHLAAARELLERYRAHPADPKYKQAQRAAREKKEREEQENEVARKRFFDTRRIFPTGIAGVGPLTAVLVAICVVISLISVLGWEEPIIRTLLISYYVRPVLPEIRAGEVWRLVTPILVHGSILHVGGVIHLFFNMLCLVDFGTMIERARSARLLALLVLGIAIPSNLAQYFMGGPAFSGMSGVVYGLIGYIWMRGKYDPNSGLFLHQTTVTMALVWYFLCLFDVIPHIANTVHTVGFAVGLAWGYLSALVAVRR